ncbi:MAG: hypothetical protein LBV47_04205, partial [Bacteroidales bacterium]|nr:hypothetical protein [Bacteroidales bacterium]
MDTATRDRMERKYTMLKQHRIVCLLCDITETVKNDRDMTSYGFCFRPSARKGSHPGMLYMRVVHGSLSRSVTTLYQIYSAEWDVKKRWLTIPYVSSERR